VLIPLGVALEARDRVTGAVDTIVANSTDALDGIVSATSSRRALDRQLKRFERRGGKARTELEREVRKTRTRLEREARHSRVRVERQAREVRRGFEHPRAEARRTLGSNVETLQSRVAPLRDRVEPVRTRVENVVQNGVSAGKKFVGEAQDRIAKVA
jgi:predicted  nucleic acid-binding Zn-ribbon protein